MVAEQNSRPDKGALERHVLGKPFVYQLGIWGVGYLPQWLSYWCARRIADISHAVYRAARENLRNNLHRVFPDTQKKKIASLTRAAFRNYSTYLVDFGRFGSIDQETVRKVMPVIDNEEYIQESLKKGNGLIVLTAHLGNWELGAVFFGRHNIRINVLTFRDGIHQIDEIRERYRKFHNINTIVLDDSPFTTVELLAALKRNEVVAMLVDRFNGDDDNSVEVEFFGKRTRFPRGPFLLAQTSGAPLMPAFVVRDGKSYRAILETPIPMGQNDSVEVNAQEIIHEFERYIRKYPDQWYNFVAL